MTLVTSTTVLGSLIDELEVFVKARELVQRATSFEPGFSSRVNQRWSMEPPSGASSGNCC